jgi:glutaredoxin 3
MAERQPVFCNVAAAFVAVKAMPRVEVYSSFWCPYCIRAKRLLKSKGVEFEEIDVDAEPAKRGEMIARADGRYTVPQIFIDGRHVGGSDDLYALERAGKLDALLGVTAER